MPKENVAGLANELTEARDHLLANASSLANLRLLNGESLKNVKTGLGYRAIANECAARRAVPAGQGG